MPRDAMTSLLRDGSVSLKVHNFTNKTLQQTRTQKSKMAQFEDKSKSDARKAPPGKLSRNEMDERKYQQTGRDYMPSGNAGRSATVPPAGRSRAPQGGRVQGSQTPGTDHIDDFPRGQGRTFPAGANYAGPAQTAPMGAKTDNTRMKGKAPNKSGGPDGHNAKSPRYYGGPNNRIKSGT